MPEQEGETFEDLCPRCWQQRELVTLDREWKGATAYILCRKCGFEMSDHDYSHAKLGNEIPAELEEAAKLRRESRWLRGEIGRLHRELKEGWSKPGTPSDNHRLMEKSQLLAKRESRFEAVSEELERLKGH